MALPKSGLTGLKTRKDNPITKESLTGAAKRIIQHVSLGPASGNFADATPYPAIGGIHRPGKLVSAKLIMNLAPASGVNTIALKRTNTGGTTLLTGASQSITAQAAGAIVDLPLSANPADLVFDGTVPVFAVLTTGTQGTPGNVAGLLLEFELDDFVG